MSQFFPQNYVGLNGGVLLTSATYNSKLHFDKAHISHLSQVLGNDVAPTHLGVINSLFNQIGLDYRGVQSLWSINAQGTKNIIEVDNPHGIYTFDKVLADDSNKAKIMSIEVTGNPARPGIDGNPIFMRLNKRLVGANAILTFSKFAGIELKTTQQPSGSDAEGYLYKTELVVNNNSAQYVPLEYLKVGFYVCAGPGITSERNEDYDDRQIGSAVARFYNSIGTAANQKYFTVTRQAALSSVATNNPLSVSLENHSKIFKMDLMDSNSYAAKGKAITGEQNVNDFLSKGYKTKGELTKSIVHTLIVPQIEMYYMALIQAENNWYAMYGNGGTTRVGKDPQTVTLPIGLMRQIMKQGNKQSYNVDNFRFDNLIGWIKTGTSKLSSVSNKMEVRVKTGMGGLLLAQEGITKKFGAVPGILNLNEFITNKGGDNLSLGFSLGFRRFTFPLGDVEVVFEYAEELDAVTGDPNQIDNPMFRNGLRLSSYAFIIDDITGQGNNIAELVPAIDRDFHLMHADGKMPYLGDPQRHNINSISNPGYEVYIEKRFHAYHLIDGAKVWMYLPINPRTRSMFGANAYDKF